MLSNTNSRSVNRDRAFYQLFCSVSEKQLSSLAMTVVFFGLLFSFFGELEFLGVQCVAGLQLEFLPVPHHTRSAA